MSRHDDRLRARLAALAGDVADWRKAIDRIDPACVCRLSTEPGYHGFDNVDCRSGQRCRAMTVLVVRSHMGILRFGTKARSAAEIPGMVQALAALFDELPTTTAWKPFADRLAAILDTGRDPNPTTQPTPAEGAPPS